MFATPWPGGSRSKGSHPSRAIRRFQWRRDRARHGRSAVAAATEVLAALTAEHNIAAAYIYSGEGEIFAEFVSNRPQHQYLLTQIAANEQAYLTTRPDVIDLPTYSAEFRPLFLDLSAPIRVDNQPLGVINIQVDIGPMMAGFYRYGEVTLVFLLLAFFLAYILSRCLQRSVTGPIKNFSNAMLQVAKSGDYSRRVEYLANEASSSEADLRGDQANRRIVDDFRLCYPMMALNHNGRYIALAWNREDYPAPLFDSPDRIFNTNAHVMGLWQPSVGDGRLENALHQDR